MIRHVFLKELRDHWRDRRSVLASLILPVLGPLMLLAVFQLVLDLDQERPLEVPVSEPSMRRAWFATSCRAACVCCQYRRTLRRWCAMATPTWFW